MPEPNSYVQTFSMYVGSTPATYTARVHSYRVQQGTLDADVYIERRLPMVDSFSLSKHGSSKRRHSSM